MDKVQAQVKEMMQALDLPLPHEDSPGLHKLNFGLLRRLVKEEALEYDEAMRQLQTAMAEDAEYSHVLRCWAEVIDAMCDIVVVVHNTSNAMGIDLEPFQDEVHQTNMAKVGGPKNEYGKALKPKGWKPPRIREMLEELLSQRSRASNS